MIRTFPASGRELYETVKSVCNDTELHERCRQVRASLENENDMDDAVSRIELLINS